ncbi:MAG: EMC3/TMCO1 family protein [Candidatus Micrarchaeota archaeon]
MLEQFDPVYVIFAIGLAYSASYQLISSKLVDRKKIKAITDESKRLQKEFGEASKKNDQKKLDEINKEYEKFMPKMMEMSLMQLKPYIFIIPALAILTPFLHDTFTAFVITLPFPLPVITDGFGRLFSLDVGGFISGLPYMRDTFGAHGWFWISVILVSISASLIRWGYNKLNANKPSSPAAANAVQGGENKEEKNNVNPKMPELNTGLAEDKKEEKEQN